MSADFAGAPGILAEAPRPGARKPVVHTWQGVDPARLESVRLVIGETRLRASGRLVTAADPQMGAEPYSASFEASVDKGDAAGKLLLRTTTAEHERQIFLSRSEDGVWMVDREGGQAQRADFEGSVSVEVAGAVTFTSLPIRQLGLHRREGEFEVPVVSVSLPDLAVTVVRHTYRTVSLDDDGAVIALTRGGTTADVRVDRDGIVVDFPGVSKRV